MSAQGKPIKKRSVKKYLHLIGQIFASVGANNPRHNGMGKLNFWMVRQLSSYQKEDYPPTRVWPLPFRVIQALDTAAHGTTSINIAISSLTWFAFFFLFLLDKYCKGDVQFFIGQQPYNGATASNAVLAQAKIFILLITTQKNGVKGGSIGHGRTGHPQECPLAE